MLSPRAAVEFRAVRVSLDFTDGRAVQDGFGGGKATDIAVVTGLKPQRAK